jgi:hypothetical protein
MQGNQASKLSQNVILKDGETKSESYVVYVQVGGILFVSVSKLSYLSASCV